MIVTRCMHRFQMNRCFDFIFFSTFFFFFHKTFDNFHFYFSDDFQNHINDIMFGNEFHWMLAHSTQLVMRCYVLKSFNKVLKVLFNFFLQFIPTHVVVDCIVRSLLIFLLFSSIVFFIMNESDSIIVSNIVAGDSVHSWNVPMNICKGPPNCIHSTTHTIKWRNFHFVNEFVTVSFLPLIHNFLSISVKFFHSFFDWIEFNSNPETKWWASKNSSVDEEMWDGYGHIPLMKLERVKLLNQDNCYCIS